METSPVTTPDPYVDPSSSLTNNTATTSTSNTSNNNSTSYGVLLNLFHSPLSLLLEYSRVVSATSISAHQDSYPVGDIQTQSPNSIDNLSSVSPGEVSIQIIRPENAETETTEAVLENEQANPLGAGETLPLVPPSVEGNTSRDNSYRSYDIQQLARWVEQVLPFSLLLLVVFIRQHLQGFFVTVWITVMIFKSNDILRKQTALKGERKNSVLIVISIGFMLHVVGIYWWFRHDDLLYPLVLIPPKTIPPFWHAIFIILVNDAMVRQAAMALKCLLLIYYKSGRGHNFRRQGQILTLIEYALLFYRALLPAPVWYRFFLNKDYGSLFSSLTTGLYLTFKLTTIVEKVQSLFAALRALSRKEVHYGSYATMEQVNAAGDLCAICQEKMHVPVLLRCKHIFCEDCVSEWLERERTCPLCRALVKAADLRSFGDGSTSLLFQLF
ncbi:RING finger and transmembrane domain-containing protein 2-like [Pistacia vera]|uniref:RING finger and transmembrane domain-containing protein 2-like n=1 Tax=Pistacia vera TaxID=55513 RepID=UPI001263A689|nr:RING finger and transmembrane domain-containing protein 2-like [Pistacia vera]